MHVVLGNPRLGQPPKIPPKVQLTADDLIDYEVKNNSSYHGKNSSFRLGTFLNQKISRGTMVKDFQKDYYEKTHTLSSFSEGEILPVFVRIKKKKELADRPIVYVKDVSEFVLHIMAELDWHPHECTIQYR